MATRLHSTQRYTLYSNESILDWSPITSPAHYQMTVQPCHLDTFNLICLSFQPGSRRLLTLLLPSLSLSHSLALVYFPLGLYQTIFLLTSSYLTVWLLLLPLCCCSKCVKVLDVLAVVVETLLTGVKDDQGVDLDTAAAS